MLLPQLIRTEQQSAAAAYTPSMNEIPAGSEARMPSLQEVEEMEPKRVYNCLVRIRKSIFKNNSSSVLSRHLDT